MAKNRKSNNVGSILFYVAIGIIIFIFLTYFILLITK